MFSVTAEKCCQSHLLARLEANSRRLVQRQRTPEGRCCSLITRYIQLATVCWAQSLTTSDIRDSDTAVLGTLAPCYAVTGGLWWRACTGLNLPHQASASRYVSATVHGRTARSADQACRGVKYPLQSASVTKKVSVYYVVLWQSYMFTE